MVNLYFLDTSALAKRYIPEIGTAWVQTIAAPQANHRIILSQLAWIELHSAIACRQREHSLTRRTDNQ
jgi:uncharacterized protein